jgi:hypothetical protein
MIAASVFFLSFGVVSIPVVTAQAAAMTDTFDLQLTVKEWCQDNPKFFENFKVKINRSNPSDNTTLTITRDPNNTGDITDIQATIETHGKSADVDAITLKGTIVLSNPAGRKAELALSGVNPGNPAHFLTLRGQATLDKFGNVNKLTGTFMVQETNTYTVDKKTGQQSGPVECLASGTFVTGKEVGGTLTVSNAPANAEGEFDANAYLSRKTRILGHSLFQWLEQKPNKVHVESVGVIYDPITTESSLMFLYGDMSDSPDGSIWTCGSDLLGPSCSGVTLNRSAGTLTLSNTVLDPFGAAGASITLNGTLTFPPF